MRVYWNSRAIPLKIPCISSPFYQLIMYLVQSNFNFNPSCSKLIKTFVRLRTVAASIKWIFKSCCMITGSVPFEDGLNDNSIIWDLILLAVHIVGLRKTKFYWDFTFARYVFKEKVLARLSHVFGCNKRIKPNKTGSK